MSWEQIKENFKESTEEPRDLMLCGEEIRNLGESIAWYADADRPWDREDIIGSIEALKEYVRRLERELGC